ncbi:hypothetical protein ABH920_009945 [Catenulispora sp. EB89]|uniref:hypothetical protein n=1 Tax=Catenulispora sp. EB89 TaxID=3156257 RepID=UPI0035188E2F
MNWAPEHRESPSEELADLAKRQLNGFDGYNVPHWRREFSGERGILGSVCYFDL